MISSRTISQSDWSKTRTPWYCCSVIWTLRIGVQDWMLCARSSTASWVLTAEEFNTRSLSNPFLLSMVVWLRLIGHLNYENLLNNFQVLHLNLKFTGSIKTLWDIYIYDINNTPINNMLVNWPVIKLLLSSKIWNVSGL